MKYFNIYILCFRQRELLGGVETTGEDKSDMQTVTELENQDLNW